MQYEKLKRRIDTKKGFLVWLLICTHEKYKNTFKRNRKQTIFNKIIKKSRRLYFFCLTPFRGMFRNRNSFNRCHSHRLMMCWWLMKWIHSRSAKYKTIRISEREKSKNKTFFLFFVFMAECWITFRRKKWFYYLFAWIFYSKVRLQTCSNYIITNKHRFHQVQAIDRPIICHILFWFLLFRTFFVFVYA